MYGGEGRKLLVECVRVWNSTLLGALTLLPSTCVRNLSGIRLPGFKSWFYHLLAT